MNELIEFLKEGGPFASYKLQTIINTINDTKEYMVKTVSYTGHDDEHIMAIVYKNDPYKIYANMYFRYLPDDGDGENVINPICLFSGIKNETVFFEERW